MAKKPVVIELSRVEASRLAKVLDAACKWQDAGKHGEVMDKVHEEIDLQINNDDKVWASPSFVRKFAKLNDAHVAQLGLQPRSPRGV